MISDKLTLLV